MSSTSDTQTLIEIAHLYYDEGPTQWQISKRMNMSRSLVSKLLTKARNAGIVEIVVHSEISHPFKEMEDRLRQILGLKVVKITDSEKGEPLDELYRETARYLTMSLSEKKVIAVSASKTIHGVAESLSTALTFPDVTFVPTSGGLAELQWSNNANMNCSILAQKFGAKSKQLYAPIVVDTKETKEVLFAQPFIRNVLESGRNADMALVGIGGTFQTFELDDEYMKELHYDYTVDESQVQGDVSFNYFDRKGETIDCMWNHLLIGLSLEDFKNIPEVMCIASVKNMERTLSNQMSCISAIHRLN